MKFRLSRWPHGVIPFVHQSRFSWRRCIIFTAISNITISLLSRQNTVNVTYLTRMYCEHSLVAAPEKYPLVYYLQLLQPFNGLFSRTTLVSRCVHTHTHTHTRLVALFPGLPGWAGTRKVKPIWTLLKQESVSGSGISWAVCKSATRSRQITMPAPHHSVFYRPDALPAAQPTASKHWRQGKPVPER